MRIVAPEDATIISDGAHLEDTAGCTREPVGTLTDLVFGDIG